MLAFREKGAPDLDAIDRQLAEGEAAVKPLEEFLRLQLAIDGDPLTVPAPQAQPQTVQDVRRQREDA